MPAPRETRRTWFVRAVMNEDRTGSGPRWQIWVGVFIALLVAATVGYAFFETFAP